jgi:hypothetical protein
VRRLAQRFRSIQPRNQVSRVRVHEGGYVTLGQDIFVVDRQLLPGSDIPPRKQDTAVIEEGWVLTVIRVVVILQDDLRLLGGPRAISEQRAKCAGAALNHESITGSLCVLVFILGQEFILVGEIPDDRPARYARR